MAYGNSSNFDNVYFFEMHTKNDEAPYFRVKKIGVEQPLDNATFVKGYIKGMFFKEELGYQPDNSKPAPMETNLILHLVDGKEMYILRVKFFMMGRSIMNSLSSLINYDIYDLPLTIRLYRTTPKDGGDKVNRVWVGYGTESLNWVFTPEEMKSKIKRITVNKKDVVDTSELDDALTNSVMAVINKMKHTGLIIPDEPIPQEGKNQKKDDLPDDDFSDFTGTTSDAPAPGAMISPGGVGPIAQAPTSDEPEDDLPF